MPRDLRYSGQWWKCDRITTPEVRPNRSNRGSNRPAETGLLEDSTFKNNSYKHRFTHKLAFIPSDGNSPSSISGKGEVTMTSRGLECTLCGDYAEKHKDA